MMAPLLTRPRPLATKLGVTLGSAGLRVSPLIAIRTVFFVNGALFASWASRIPALSDRVGATPGVLGLALLAPAVGAIVAMPTVGRLLPGRSSRTFCRWAIVALCLALLLPGLAGSVPALALALLLIGLANSTLDLTMNAQGMSVERQLGRPVLSSLHAAFSFGGFAGAGLGALAAGTGSRRFRIWPLPRCSSAASDWSPLDPCWLSMRTPTPTPRPCAGADSRRGCCCSGSPASSA